ncbi:Wound-induced polypeptide 3 [Hibiscus trionum]|uniref:Wound-induced polypeptide 3 n=1 Tax=Hibiscus trionum TaxID=183268 RepID=A0A9W7MKK9_HIBTR|nr:Wound-induced polypeptide 3 [Hibiscus trionum]
MSLRYASRVFYQSGMRAVQLMKDHASKCEPNLRSLKDSASSSKQARRLSNTVDFKAAAAKKERLKQAEESLRTVMFLSCWGPN